MLSLDDAVAQVKNQAPMSLDAAVAKVKVTPAGGNTVAGYNTVGRLSSAPIHYGTHAEDGVKDITEAEARRQGKSLDWIAKDLANQGYIAAVRLPGMRGITNPHVHFADPKLAPKEAARLTRQAKSNKRIYMPSVAEMAQASEAENKAAIKKTLTGKVKGKILVAHPASVPIMGAPLFGVGTLPATAQTSEEAQAVGRFVAGVANKPGELIGKRLLRPDNPVGVTTAALKAINPELGQNVEGGVETASAFAPYFTPAAPVLMAAQGVGMTGDPGMAPAMAQGMVQRPVDIYKDIKSGKFPQLSDIIGLLGDAAMAAGAVHGVRSLRGGGKPTLTEMAPKPAEVAPVVKESVTTELTGKKPVANKWWEREEAIKSITPKTVAESGPPSVASVKNAVTTQQRTRLGLAPLETKSKTSEAKRMQTAQDLIDSGAVDPDKMAADVVANPRPLDLTETDVMKHHLASLERQLSAVRMAGGDTKPLEAKFDVATKATRLAGTEQGRALQARADEIDPYSLERLLQRGRENRPNFGPKEEQSVITLHQKLQAGQVAEEALQSRLRGIKRVVVKSSTEFQKPQWGDGNTLITKDTLNAARERMLARSSRLNAVVLPDPGMIADLAIEIGYHVEAGVRFSYKAMRDYLRKEYGASDKEIQAAYSQATNDKRLKGSIERQQKLSAELNQAISSKDAPAKIPPIEYNNEWVKLHKQNVELRAKLDSVVNPNKSLGAKVRDLVTNSMNATTGLLASWDDSFVGRQGSKMLAHQPKAWGRGTVDSLRALKSEPVAWTIDAAIREDPKFALAQRSKLEYTELEPTAKMSSAEESAMYARSFEKIPLVGKIARPFDRAYTTAANVMRHDAFYRMADAMGDKWSAEDYGSYAAFLNKLTGRGDLGRLSSLQPELSGLFISARKVAADTQLLFTPFTGTKAARAEAAKTLVRYTGALATLAVVVNASGKGKVSLNPNDPDFMKLRVKNTRFDLTGGEASLIRTVWRAGKATFDYSRYGKAKYGQATPSDVVLKYLNNKMSPGVQAAKSLVTGKDFIGQPTSPVDVGKGLITPWNVNDITDAWNTDGAGMGVTAGIAGFWGLSAQSYKDKPKKTGKDPFTLDLNMKF
jgi:hypothetical protein